MSDEDASLDARRAVTTDPGKEEDDSDLLVLEYAAPGEESEQENQPAVFPAAAGLRWPSADPQTGLRPEPGRWEPRHLKEESNLVFYEGGDHGASFAALDEIQEQPQSLPDRADTAAAASSRASRETSWANAPVQLVWAFLLRLLGPYFEIESDDIILRVTRAIVPLRPLLAGGVSTDSFGSRLRKVWGRLRPASRPDAADTDDLSAVRENVIVYSSKADLYGPFWIATTIILLLSMSSTVSRLIRQAWLGHTIDVQAVKPLWKRSDAIRMTISATVIYGYETLAATLFWALRRFLFRSGEQVPGWATTACVFGYAQSPFILAAMLALFPQRLFQTVVVAVASVFSVSFLMRNLLIEPLAGETVADDVSTPATVTVQWQWKQSALIPALVSVVFQIGFAIWFILFLVM
jgi:hypothetical protein